MTRTGRLSEEEEEDGHGRTDFVPPRLRLAPEAQADGPGRRRLPHCHSHLAGELGYTGGLLHFGEFTYVNLIKENRKLFWIKLSHSNQDIDAGHSLKHSLRILE